MLKKVNEKRETLLRGIRTAKRLGLRSQSDIVAKERDIDSWLAVLLAKDFTLDLAKSK